MREWIQEKLGVVGAGVICLLAVCILGYFMFRGDPTVAAANTRMYICSETGQPFEHTIKDGEIGPVKSPHSGKNTGYPAERCYWTADGKAKREPTYILINKLVGKDGPTICPDCGRRVIGHNPRPPREKWEELAAEE